MNKKQLSRSDIKKACDVLRMDDGVGASNYIEQFSWLLFLKIFENIEEELKELTSARGQKYQEVIKKEYKWSSWAKKEASDRAYELERQDIEDTFSDLLDNKREEMNRRGILSSDVAEREFAKIESKKKESWKG